MELGTSWSRAKLSNLKWWQVGDIKTVKGNHNLFRWLRCIYHACLSPEAFPRRKRVALIRGEPVVRCTYREQPKMPHRSNGVQECHYRSNFKSDRTSEQARCRTFSLVCSRRQVLLIYLEDMGFCSSYHRRRGNVSAVDTVLSSLWSPLQDSQSLQKVDRSTCQMQMSQPDLDKYTECSRRLENSSRFAAGILEDWRKLFTA